MPKAKVKTKKTVIMKMTEEEAQWLKLKMQYPIVQGDSCSEDKKEADIRRSFWDNLQV